MDGLDAILQDFQRMKKAAEDLSGKKIYVGIDGGADSTVIQIAHAHEYGAVIKPVRKKWLAIPVTHKASKTAPLRMNLHFVKYSETKAALKDAEGETQFILLKETVLPERSFIRASFDQDGGKIDAIAQEQIDAVLKGGKSADAAANAIGAQASQLVRVFIRQNRVRPETDNSKKAIRSNQRTTLFDTGAHIVNRIAYEVVEE